MKSDRYFSLAENMAYKSTSKVRLGAVLVRKHKIISTGFNQMSKTHPVMLPHANRLGWEVGLHAEVHTCIGVPARDLQGADMYVVRVRADESIAIAKPCEFCYTFLASVGLRAVYFTTNSGRGKLKF